MKKSILTIALTLLITLTSCSNQQPQNQGDNTSDDDKNLLIAINNEPEEGFDPCVGWGRYGNPLFQSTLLKTDADMNIVNDLATDYKISDDGLTWTVNIKDDVLFSDGKPLDAEDVAFTYRTTKNSGSVVDLSVLDEVVVIDNDTVEFKLKKPQSTFVYLLASIGIVPEENYGDDYAKNPIGSGPFKLIQWDKGQQVIMQPNEYYYGIQSEFEQITLLFMTEDTAYAVGNAGGPDSLDVIVTNFNLATNELDGMTLQNYQTIDNRGLTLPMLPNTGETTAEGYPIGNNVTSDLAIRQALSYGIDRNELVDVCLNGFATPAYSESDGMPWASDDAFVEYDFDKAIKILEDGGWKLNPTTNLREKNGEVASFTLLYSAGDLTRQSLSFAVSNSAKKLGIEISIEGVSWDEIDRRMFSNAVLMGWGSQNPMESYYLYHSSNKGVDYYNPEFFSNETVDKHLENALIDFDNSMDMFKQIQWDGETGVSTKGDCPWVWLVNVDHLFFVSDKIDTGNQQIHPHNHDWPVLANLNEWSIID